MVRHRLLKMEYVVLKIPDIVAEYTVAVAVLCAIICILTKNPIVHWSTVSKIYTE